jgi:2-dehydropantoate 2-reductase
VTAVVEMADIAGAEAPNLRAVHAAIDLLARRSAPGAGAVTAAPQ